MTVRSHVTKKTPRSSPLAAAPRQPVRAMPPSGAVPSHPSPDPVTKAPPLRATRVPRQRAVAKVPNPKRPAFVRSRDGGDLLDLFAFFPDLPRPPRPAPRAFKRQIHGRFGP